MVSSSATVLRPMASWNSYTRENNNHRNVLEQEKMEDGCLHMRPIPPAPSARKSFFFQSGTGVA